MSIVVQLFAHSGSGPIETYGYRYDSTELKFETMLYIKTIIKYNGLLKDTVVAVLQIAVNGDVFSDHQNLHQKYHAIHSLRRVSPSFSSSFISF